MAALAGKSQSLNKKVLQALKGLFDSAAANGLCASNPAAFSGASRRKPGGRKPARREPLTREQQAEVAAAAAGTRAELFTLLCLYAGLRREEALGLLWRDAHLDHAAPHVEVCNVTRFVGGGNAPEHSPKLKSDAAARLVPIPPILADALRGARGGSRGVFVVASASGGPMSKSAFRKMWDPLPRALPFHVHPHLLRHTYITELCASGMDVKKVQYLAGHATAQMTLDIYAKAVYNRPEDLMPLIAAHFSEANPKGGASGAG